MQLFLSMGRLPDPHLGEWTQLGQPTLQGQWAMVWRLTASNSRMRPKTCRASPTPSAAEMASAPPHRVPRHSCTAGWLR